MKIIYLPFLISLSIGCLCQESIETEPSVPYCTDAEDCLDSEFCQDGTCQTRLEVGEVCAEQRDCQPQLWCRLDDWGSCQEHSEECSEALGHCITVVPY